MWQACDRHMTITIARQFDNTVCQYVHIKAYAGWLLVGKGRNVHGIDVFATLGSTWSCVTSTYKQGHCMYVNVTHATHALYQIQPVCLLIQSLTMILSWTHRMSSMLAKMPLMSSAASIGPPRMEGFSRGCLKTCVWRGGGERDDACTQVEKGNCVWS